MNQPTTSQHPSSSAELGAPFHPQLGDLARDTARNGRVGVVVALPGPEAATYHMRPPGGGAEWSAPANGTTLRPVPAQATHVTPMKRDAVYDHRAKQGAVPVQIHYDDGSTTEALLVRTPGQMELHHCQVGRLVDQRAKACEGTA